MSAPSLSLYKKINAVMQDIEYLSKDDNVEFKNTKYKAISEEKVTSTVRASLIKHGLVIFPIEQQANKIGAISTVSTKYKIVDIDTGEFEILASNGEGSDTQDKGVGKAMTYAYKYLLLRTFAIPTGEDPDKVSSAELDEKQRKAEEEDAKKLPVLKAKWQTLAGNLDGFEAWHEKMRAEGHTNTQLDQFLTKKLAEKKKGGAA